MKKTTALIILMTVVINVVAKDYKKYNNELWRGNNFCASNGSFCTYAVPEEYPFIEGTPVFNVSINDKAYVGLYNDFNYWNGNVCFGYFDFKEGTHPTITITTDTDINDFELLPHNADISHVEKDRRHVSFNINKPNQNITLVINGNYKGNVLHLFCNRMEKQPVPSDKYNKVTHYDKQSQTYFFGPGYWNLKKIPGCNGSISIKGKQKIYVAPGAVINGQLRITESNKGVECARIFGHGMVMNDKETGLNSLSVEYSEGGHVEGILVHTHRKHCWQTVFSNCSNIKVNDMKIVCTRYASTDGIDIIASNNCSFDNVFVRSSDDCVAIKGLGNLPPVKSKPQSGLEFKRMQLWNDCNNAFGIGAETRAAYFSDISLTDSEILFSYDDPEFHEHLDERSAMNICSLHGTFFHNIKFENIYVNRCERLIAMGFKSSFWFGALQGDQSTDGEISGITFRNIYSPYDSGSGIANKIWLYGWYSPGTPTKYIHDINFDNVVICGKKINSDKDPNIITTNKAVDKRLVYNMTFN